MNYSPDFISLLMLGLGLQAFRRPRVCGWASKSCGLPEQKGNCLRMATLLDSDISHRFSNFLLHFQHDRALFGPNHHHCKVLCESEAIPSPYPPALGKCACGTGEKTTYLKWREIQLAGHWRLCPQKDLVWLCNRGELRTCSSISSRVLMHWIIKIGISQYL